MAALRDRIATQPPAFVTPVWTSHEALLLDYEVPLVRSDETGRRYLASTHWPWIGYRTNQLDGAHVALLASVANPVASKVGPGMSTDELLALCERLDPDREPGRLTLIARMGAEAVAEQLPAMAAAVRAAGHPVIWLSDPMHGNTVTAPEGRKTRLVETVLREVKEFQNAIADAGAVVGGLHLETTPDDVTECAHDEHSLESVGDRYTTLCDPRLNPAQALEVAAAWQGRPLFG
jgi:3-deoxy-7-phosphoheptulonate synthase